MKNTNINNDLFRSVHLPKYLNIFTIALLACLMSVIGPLVGSLGFKLPVSPVVKMGVFILIIGFGLTSLICFAFVTKVEKRPISSLGLGHNGALKKYIIGFAIGLSLMGFVVLTGWLLGAFQISFTLDTNHLFTGLGPILLMLLGFIIQGGTEEVITRGWALTRIGSKYSVAIAVSFTSVFFTSLHLLNPGMTLIPIINISLFAVLAALVVVHTGSLWQICGLHSAWNWFQANFFGIKVSGNDVVGGSILTTVPTEGQDLLSGGIFGAEGSIICSIVMFIGIVYLTYRILFNRAAISL